MNPFQSLREYERVVYTLQQQFPHIVRSTLVVARRGRLYADLSFTAPNLPFLIHEIETTLL